MRFPARKSLSLLVSNQECDCFYKESRYGVFEWKEMILPLTTPVGMLKKTLQTIWQDILDYARIVWGVACKNTDKATSCNDMLGLFWFHHEHPRKHIKLSFSGPW